MGKAPSTASDLDAAEFCQHNTPALFQSSRRRAGYDFQPYLLEVAAKAVLITVLFFGGKLRDRHCE